LCLALLAGCLENLPLESERSTLMMFGVVVADADSVFIALGRTGSAISTAGESEASLTLTIDGSELQLEEGPSGACGTPEEFSCYRAQLAGRARTSSIVRIRGRLTTGEEFQGEALVPEVPNIHLEGAPSDTAHLAPDQPAQVLGLENAPYRVDTTLDCTSPFPFQCNSPVLVDATVWVGSSTRICRLPVPGPPAGEDLRTYDRVSLSAGQPACPDTPTLAWDSAAVTITLYGYDRNFTEWGAAGEKVLDRSQGWGVTGAFGVFGAAVPRRFVLMILNDNG
jgi:hypothetical protein